MTKMRKAVVYLFVILTFICVNLYLGFHVFQRYEAFRLKNATLAIEPLMDNPPGLAGIVDIDKDGNDEVIFTRPHQFPEGVEFWLFDPGKRYPGPVEKWGTITTPPDYVFFDAYLQEKSNACIFRFLVREKDNFVLMEWNASPGSDETNTKGLKGEEVTRGNWKRQELDGLNYKIGKEKFSFSGPDFVDFEGDGSVEMLVMLSSYYIRQPRGIVCFNADSKELLWEYYCGTMLDQVVIRDLEGDGSKEIILSTGGLNNGAVLNGTDDAHAYVIVLDCSGNELWKKEVGEWYTFARSLAVKDLDHDGTVEIIAATDTHRAHPGVRGTIFIFNALTGEEKKFYRLVHASFSTFFIRDDGPGDTRIYVGDGSGCIRMFDRDLNLIKTIREDSPIFVLNAAVPAKKWNFLLANTHDRLLAFDWELKKKVFEYRFEQPSPRNMDIVHPLLNPFHTTQGHEALIYSDKLYRLRDVRGSILDTGKNLVISGLLLVVLALFLFNGFFVYALRRLNSSGYSYPYRLQRKETVLMPRFLDIVQEIVQQVKTPISTISWTAEKIKQANDTVKEEKTREGFRQLAGFLGDDVKVLKQQANRLLRLVQIYNPRFRETALKPFLENLLEHYRAVVDEKVTIRLEMEEDISLSLDPELFKEALLNLVDNALAAMPGGGKLTVSAVPVTSHLKGAVKEVLIEVEDTGHGIDDEDLSRVFQPFFTGKRKGSGTGIGLTICRRIIDVHGGTIEIHSRKHFGTKTVITIPVDAGSAGGTGTADR